MTDAVHARIARQEAAIVLVKKAGLGLNYIGAWEMLDRAKNRGLASWEFDDRTVSIGYRSDNTYTVEIGKVG